MKPDSRDSARSVKSAGDDDIAPLVWDVPRPHLEHALETSDFGVCISGGPGGDYRVSYVNAAFERMTGYRSDEVLGRNCRVLQGDDTDQETLDLVRGSLAAGTSCRVTVRNYRKDGSPFWNELHLSPYQNDGGVVTAVVAFMNDVTAQAEAEQQLSSESFLPLMRHMAGMTIVDAKGTVLLTSDAMLLTLGYQPSDLIGKNIFDLPHADDIETAHAGFDKALAAPGTPVPFTVRCRHHDGSWRHLEVVAVNQLQHPAVRGVILNSRDITERQEYLEQLRHQAFHDTLTGLPNRALLEDRVQHAISTASAESSDLALVLIDIDHFDDVQMAMGRRTGDQLLVEIGNRLRTLVRTVDTVAYLGGDTFALLLPGAKLASATWTARKILSALLEPIALPEGDLQATANIGIALYPEHGIDQETLLRHADAAANAAKRARSGYAFYASEQSRSRGQVDRLMLVGDLRQALKDQILILHYEPKVDVRTSRVAGVDALVRWPHATRGLLEAEQFIGAAERTGVIVPLTLWAIEAAIAEWRRWHDAQLPIAIAMEVSVYALQDSRFSRAIATLLAKYSLAAGDLTLEIDEGSLNQATPAALKTAGALNALGVRLAISSFGTGFLGLTQLKHIAVQEIKIDRRFVQAMDENPTDAAVVRSIVDLGHSLDMVVVAEGVERRRTWDALMQLGCDVVQGTYCSKPQTGPGIYKWLLSSAFGFQHIVG